jgi:hypothetical protein
MSANSKMSSVWVQLCDGKALSGQPFELLYPENVDALKKAVKATIQFH